jgi:drug/metabolite transporter (DMT)-like permease
MVISGFLLLFFTRITGHSIALAVIPWQSWAAISYLVIFGSIISFIAYLYALQHLSAEQTSIYAYINPIIAVIFGWLLFSERLTVFIGVGGIITLTGVYLINKAYKTPLTEMPETEGV